MIALTLQHPRNQLVLFFCRGPRTDSCRKNVEGEVDKLVMNKKFGNTYCGQDLLAKVCVAKVEKSGAPPCLALG